MDMLKHFFILSVTFCLVGAIFKDCGSKGKVSSVTISGCDGKGPCPLKRGTNASITITFNSEQETSKQLLVKIYGVIAGVPVPFNPPNKDGCKNSGISCPVVQNKAYSYTAVIPVLEHYPKIELAVKYELQETDHENNQLNKDGSVSGTLESVDITPCPTQPCQIKHRTNVTLAVKFKSNVDTKKAKSVLHGIIDNIPTPFPLPNDACLNNNVACPIQNGSDLIYKNYMYVLPEFPKM
ncbi:hypothetical protein KUTeg_013753 [Tegillarca granosa]|uniref:MD-2-related lipid-recognition domain-containing protein n=1 Tax=Tegillarca granosa TaxID=220873 RepID=A0ABQ9EUZ3_TEGGR|nr:hypothetical protein KUTeg_013753 [Tegillarca granosa]